MTMSLSRLSVVLTLALALATALSILPARPAAADLITLVGDATRAVPSGGTGSVVFPITLTAEGRAGPVTATVTDVRLASEPRSTEAIEPSVDATASRLTLEITDGAPFARAGDYTVVLTLAGAANETQQVTVILKPNTVQLGRCGGVGGWRGGLRPVRMVCAFGSPFEDFAFHDAWVRAWPSARVEVAGEPLDRAPPEHVGVLRLLRGKKSLA